MDPLSITASAVAVIQAAGFTTTTVYKFVQSIRTADSRIASLCDELSSLQNYLESVRNTLDECRSRELVPAQPDLWQRCDEALKDCLVTLTLLEALVNRIKDASLAKGKGLRWLARASIDLSIHGDALAAFREKIQKSNIALQTMLHTITLSLSLKNDASQDKILFELEQLRCSFKEALRVSIRSGRADDSDARISRNLHNLATAARQFHSAASSTSGTSRGGSYSPSSVRAFSLMGDFPEHKRRQVEAFIEEGCYSVSGSVESGSQRVPVVPSSLVEAQASFAGTSPVQHTIQLRAAAMLGDEDDENEYEREYYDGLEDLARDRIMKGEYNKAIDFLTQATKRHADADPGHSDSRSLKVQLALCHFLQGNWKAAEPMVTSLSAVVDGVSCNLLHALSLGYLSEYSFDSALETCRKAMHGKKWLLKVAPLGVKEHAQYDYATTMALFATIHHMNGDPIRAEIFDRRLPQGFQYEHPVNALEFLVKHPGFLQKALGHDIPASFTPIFSGHHLAHGVNTQLTGPQLTPHRSMGVQWHGEFTPSPLRTRFAHFERYEDDTLKYVTAGPSPCSPADSGIDMDLPNDVSPLQASPDEDSAIDIPVSGALLERPTQIFPGRPAKLRATQILTTQQPRNMTMGNRLDSREILDAEDTPDKTASPSSKWLIIGSPFGFPRSHGSQRKKLDGDLLENKTPTAVARRSRSFRLRNMVAALKKPTRLRQASQHPQHTGTDQKNTHVWTREDASRFMGVSPQDPERDAAVACPDDLLSERRMAPLHGPEDVSGSIDGGVDESTQATAGPGGFAGRFELADTALLFKLSDTCITPVGIVDKWNMVSTLTTPSTSSSPSAAEDDTDDQGSESMPEKRMVSRREDAPDQRSSPVSTSSPKPPNASKQIAEQIPSRLAAVLMSLPDACDTKKRLVVKSKLKALLRDVELLLYDPMLAQDLRGIIDSLQDGADLPAVKSSSRREHKERRRDKIASDEDLDALWKDLPTPKGRNPTPKVPLITPTTTTAVEASLESAPSKRSPHPADDDGPNTPTDLLPSKQQLDCVDAEAESNACHHQAPEEPPGSTREDRRWRPDERLHDEKEDRPAAASDLRRVFSFIAGDDARFSLAYDDQWPLPRSSVTDGGGGADQDTKYLGTWRHLLRATNKLELTSG